MNTETPQPAVNSANANLAGQAYWRSLNEYAQSEHIQKLLDDEFADYDPKAILNMSRRRFMQLMGAGLALAGVTLTGCRRWPEEKLAPFAHRPDDRMPGVPVKYATVCERNGHAMPAMVTAYDGRPIKLAGNPNHPLSPFGCSDVFLQAETLSLYDPYRARWARRRSTRSGKLENVGQSPEEGWNGFYNWCRDTFDGTTPGGQIAVLHEPTSSPTFAALKDIWAQQNPGIKFYAWTPVNRDNEIQGARLLYEQYPCRWTYKLKKAKRIVALGSDFLTDRADSLKLASDWAANRRSCDQGEMSRMYVIEPSMTSTGSVADHRLPLPASLIPAVAATMVQMLGFGEAKMDYSLPDKARAFVQAMVEDLKATGDDVVVIAGPGMPAEVHAMAVEISGKLGDRSSIPAAVPLEDPSAKEPLLGEQIADLTQRINAGEITQLIILGGNPIYDAPADVDFAAALKKITSGKDATGSASGGVIHLTHEENETSQLATWVLPRAHFLESWGDARAFDGTLSIQQPLILPLFAGKTPAEVLDIISSNQPQSSYEMTRRVFEHDKLLPAGDFETQWRIALHDGFVKDSAFKMVKLIPSPGGYAKSVEAPKLPASEGQFEIVFQRDASLLDGRYAGNGWLQETARPMTKITWDNAALISVKDAEKLGVVTGNNVTITVAGQAVTLPVYRMPGQAEGSIAIQLGYGRTAGSPVAMNVGQNVYPLRRSDAMHHALGEVAKAGGTYELAMTIEHHLIDGTAPASSATESAAWAMKKRLGEPRQSGLLVKETTLENYKQHPHFAEEGEEGNISLQLFPQEPEFRAGPHAWGMTIDMTACINCSACITSCQAENNIPVVGRDMVRMSREMHWIRVDRYFKGDPADPEVVNMPVMCVQCENAPCEQVCPVAATMHDTEGLNVMVYNRCIGTRYCSNNCPYKVRRFNYFDWHAKPTPNSASKPWLGIPDQEQQSIPELKRMVYNPDVTVRMRGVMEKCSYCVQRIHAAKTAARLRAKDNPLDDGLVKDGEVVTACQEACPTQAIVFGDLGDPNSRVTRQQKIHRSYGLLAELNTRPRTKHLAKITNPNPKLVKTGKRPESAAAGEA